MFINASKGLKTITSAFVCCWILVAPTSFAECVDDASSSRFVVQTGGATVRDAYTGLSWQRCLVGYRWSVGEQSCLLYADEPIRFTWQEALAFAGDGWRLPNAKELESIVDRNCFEPALHTGTFPAGDDIMIGAQWTSSQIESYAGGAWTVNFKTGSVISSDKSERLPVRLLRDSSL